MSRSSIGPTRSQESRKAILQAAAEILAEKGVSGFSIDQVAKRAKAGKPTIYRWWKTKAELLLEVYQTRQSSIMKPPTGDVISDICDLLTGLFALWRKESNGIIFRCLVAEGQKNEESAQALARYAAFRHDQTAQIIAHAQSMGRVRDTIDPKMISEMIIAFAWHRLLTAQIDLTREQIEAYIAPLLQGIIIPKE